jgi:hypothetical protein
VYSRLAVGEENNCKVGKEDIAETERMRLESLI